MLDELVNGMRYTKEKLHCHACMQKRTSSLDKLNHPPLTLPCSPPQSNAMQYNAMQCLLFPSPTNPLPHPLPHQTITRVPSPLNGNNPLSQSSNPKFNTTARNIAAHKTVGPTRSKYLALFRFRMALTRYRYIQTEYRRVRTATMPKEAEAMKWIAVGLAPKLRRATEIMPM